MEMQEIFTQKAGLFSGNLQKSSVSSQKSEGKNGVVFQDYMTNATKQTKTTTVKNQNSCKEVVDSANSKQEMSDTSIESDSEVVETQDSVTEITQESKNTEAITQDVQIQEESEVTENVTDDLDFLLIVQNAVHEWKEEVQEVLCEEFDITLEELENIMADLGVQLVDLQKLPNIQQLVLAVAGTDDKTALLTNETLAAQVISVQKTIEQITAVITQEYGFEDANYLMQETQQEITDSLKSVTENFVMQEETQVDETKNKEMMPDDAGMNKQEDVQKMSEDDSKNYIQEKNIANGNSVQDKNVKEIQHKTEKNNILIEEPVAENKEVQTSDMEKVQVSVEKNSVSKDVGTEEIKTEPKIEVSMERTSEATEEIIQDNNNEFSGSEKRNESQSLFEHFVENLSVNRTVTVEQTNMKMDAITQMREIVTQVVEQVKVRVNVDTTSMEIQLNPENLGKVNLTVVAKEGHITAQFVTENEIARQALEGQVQQLRETLGEQGLKVDEVEVTVSNFDFSHRNQANTEEQKQQHSQEQRRVHRNLNLNETIDVRDLSEEEQLAARIMIDNGNQVDYTA